LSEVVQGLCTQRVASGQPQLTVTRDDVRAMPRPTGLRKGKGKKKAVGISDADAVEEEAVDIALSNDAGDASTSAADT
jgi:hypothetical protein